MKPLGLTGSKMEKILEALDISVNKNTIAGDTSPMNPSGVRLGSPAMTTRGCDEADSRRIVEFLVEAAKLALDIQAAVGPKLVNFIAAFEDERFAPRLAAFRTRVHKFSSAFHMPGNDTTY